MFNFLKRNWQEEEEGLTPIEKVNATLELVNTVPPMMLEPKEEDKE